MNIRDKEGLEIHEMRRGVFEDNDWCCDGFLVMVRFQPHKMMSNTQHKAKLCTLSMESWL